MATASPAKMKYTDLTSCLAPFHSNPHQNRIWGVPPPWGTSSFFTGSKWVPHQKQPLSKQTAKGKPQLPVRVFCETGHTGHCIGPDGELVIVAP